MSGDVNSIKIVVYESQPENSNKKDFFRFNKLCKFLALRNIKIIRYSINQNKDIFLKNEDLHYLISCAGIENLPATYVNGEIFKIEEYPTKKDINKWISL